MMTAVWLTRGILRDASDGRASVLSPRTRCGIPATDLAARTDARGCCDAHDHGMRVILVATDGSRAASAALDAGDLAGSRDGRRGRRDHRVAGTAGRLRARLPLHRDADELLDAERTHAEATLGDAIARAEEAGVAIRTRLTTGDPAEQICAYAEEIDARLIAIGTRGHGTVASLLLGSVSNAVIRGAPCPVLVVREPERTRERHRSEPRRSWTAEPRARIVAWLGLSLSSRHARTAWSKRATQVDGVAHASRPSSATGARAPRGRRR